MLGIILTKYGVRNWGDFVKDANVVPQPIDESDSEGSVVEEYMFCI